MKRSYLARAVAALGLVTVLAGAWAVGSAASQADKPTMGTIPEKAFTPQGIDETLVPDYVSALDNEGNVVGFVRKGDILPGRNRQPSDVPVAVFDSSLERVVGHMYPGRGYVAAGESPDKAPITVTTVAGDASG